MAKKVFILQEGVIDVFHNNFYNPTIEILSFHIAHVWIISPI